MAKKKANVAKTGAEVAKALGLPASDAYEWEVQANLLAKLREAIAKSKLTHAEVAKRAGTSRTRITSILGAHLDHVSTDMLIRLLGVLGYEVHISVSKSKLAA